jgi:hypothetical protein
LAGCNESLGAAGDITTSNVVDDDKAGDWGGSEQDNLVEELSTASSSRVLFLGLSSAAKCLALETMSMTSGGSSHAVREERAMASHSFWSSRRLGMVSYHFPTGGIVTHSLPSGSHK